MTDLSKPDTGASDSHPQRELTYRLGFNSGIGAVYMSSFEFGDAYEFTDYINDRVAVSRHARSAVDHRTARQLISESDQCRRRFHRGRSHAVESLASGLHTLTRRHPGITIDVVREMLQAYLLEVDIWLADIPLTAVCGKCEPPFFLVDSDHRLNGGLAV